MLKHTDIRVGTYYHLTYDGNPNEWVIVKTESKDDDEGYRWTGPCINASDGESDFEDGSDDSHGGYFGGEKDAGIEVVVRYATPNEIEWLDACIEAEELVDKPTQKSNTMEITQMTPDMVGKKFTCSIEGIEITDGRIQYESHSYYLCQNEKSGSSCSDKLCYTHSWSVQEGTASRLRQNHVTKLVIVEELPTLSITAPQTINEKLLIDGEIYTYQENYLFMQKAKRPGMAYASTYIKPSGRSYGTNADLSGGRFKTTTMEEKAHLNACIAAKKYVDPPKIELNQEQMDFLIQAMLAKSED
jgi:hypothetical protein